MGYLNNPGVAAFIGGINPGAPFNIDEFRDFTGILTPPFGDPSNLHPDLTQADSDLCKAYLDSAWAFENAEARTKFIQDDRSRGKEIFNKWYAKQWKVNETSAKFDRFMHEHGIDAAGMLSVGEKPSVTRAAPVFPALAQALFGSQTVHILASGGERVKEEWQPVIAALVFASYARARKIAHRLEKKLTVTLERLETQFKGMRESFSLLLCIHV